MYTDVKSIQHNLHHVDPKKFVAIKEEVEIFFCASSIYPVALIDWVSNIFPIMKKQGTIRVCIDYQDVNHVCPKEKF